MHTRAGSGTILEGLSIGKKLVVVVNDKLMDNHQTEIASVMGQAIHPLPSPTSPWPCAFSYVVHGRQAKHVFDTTPTQLLSLLAKADFEQLLPTCSTRHVGLCSLHRLHLLMTGNEGHPYITSEVLYACCTRKVCTIY